MRIDIDRIRVGDRIHFHVRAIWRTRPTAWRTVTLIKPWIGVRIGGWSDFIVHSSEIIEHIERYEKRK